MSGLTVRNLAVAAGGKRLLEGLDLRVERGRLVGLSGPSGLGKSTLLRALAGLIDPAAPTGSDLEAEAADEPGSVLLLDDEPPETIGWAAYRRRVVYVAQRPVLLDRSVRDNLARPFEYESTRGPFPAERAKELLDRLGLADRLNQAARTLSVGEQQRVALARTLLVEPEIVLLDEPTSALDAESVATVEQLLRDEVDAGRLGGVVVSHDKDQLGRWCDHVVDLTPLAVEASS